MALTSFGDEHDHVLIQVSHDRELAKTCHYAHPLEFTHMMWGEGALHDRGRDEHIWR